MLSRIIGGLLLSIAMPCAAHVPTHQKKTCPKKQLKYSKGRPVKPQEYIPLDILFGATEPAVPRHLAVIIVGHNQVAWLEQTLASVFTQHYNNYELLYVDDASTDGSCELVELLVNKAHKQARCSVIKHTQEQGAALCYYEALQRCSDDTICLLLDAGDWLLRPNVLALYNKLYADSNIWLTYGQYIGYPSGERGICREIPDQVMRTNNFRRYKWVPSHCKTFYAWLFKKLPREICYMDEQPIMTAADMALMLPLLELAGCHSMFVHEPIYCVQEEAKRPPHELLVQTEQWLRSQQPFFALVSKDAQAITVRDLYSATAQVSTFCCGSVDFVCSNRPCFYY